MLPNSDPLLTELFPDGTIACLGTTGGMGGASGATTTSLHDSKAVMAMPMQMWLTRPREFEQLDQAINDRCCRGEEGLRELDDWVAMLDAAASAPGHDGIGDESGVFSTASGPNTGEDHFYQHWVGNYRDSVPPSYWPYAWGRSQPPPPKGKPKALDPQDQWLRIDALMSAGLAWSIRKVIAARRNVDLGTASESDRPACSPCRTHITVWVCFEVSEPDKAKAEVDLAFRRSLFRLGVVEARDSVMLLVKTPRPIELTGGVCDPTKAAEGGDEQLYKEPVIVTEAFTSATGDGPRWIQPISTAPTVLGSGTIFEVEEQPLPKGGVMPAGKYPDDVDVNECKFVSMPTVVGDPESDTALRGHTASELIKEIIRGATSADGLQMPGRLDLSEELIGRLRITIVDEPDGAPREHEASEQIKSILSRAAEVPDFHVPRELDLSEEVISALRIGIADEAEG